MEDQCKAMREKHWFELSDSEQIERMHGEVKRLQRSNDRLQYENRQLRKHQHGINGEILVPITDSSEVMSESLALKGQEWF